MDQLGRNQPAVDDPGDDGEDEELLLVPPVPFDELSVAAVEVELLDDVVLDEESLPAADPLLPRESVR